MTVTRAAFQRLYYPGLKDFIFKGFDEEQKMMYDEWTNVKDSDAAFEEDFTAAGLGLFALTPENVEMAEDEFRPGFRKRYNHADYTLAVGFSHQAIRDAKVPIWNERAGDLGFSARQTMEVLIHDILNSGFSGTGPDGVALFASNHPNIRTGTQSNILSTASTPGQTSIRNMLIQFRKFFDDTGVRRVNLIPKDLWHPPELEYDVLEHLRSAGRPDTANRADNVIRNKLEPRCNVYLTDSNNWFVFAEKGRHKIKVYIRERLSTKTFEDDRTDINWVKARISFSYGFSHWRGVMGTNPA